MVEEGIAAFGYLLLKDRDLCDKSVTTGDGGSKNLKFAVMYFKNLVTT